MLRRRVIPVLLLKDGGLVKTVRFKNPVYIGDPINAVKVFNDKEVDELIFLDITATKEGRDPPLDKISEIAGESFMPVGYGGGIKSMAQVEAILNKGIEKVILNSSAVSNYSLVYESAKRFGSQSIVISVDVKKNLMGKHTVRTESGTKNTGLDPSLHVKKMVENGAGEIFINSIDRDGTYSGYDIGLIRKISEVVNVPVIACGGARNVHDFVEAVREGGASGVAAGSMFVFYGKARGILINYPSQEVLQEEFYSHI